MSTTVVDAELYARMVEENNGVGGAIGVAVGRASKLWKQHAGDGTSDDLARVIMDTLYKFVLEHPTTVTVEHPVGSMTSEEANWLLVLLQFAKPLDPDNEATNWEPNGRKRAEEILRRAMDKQPCIAERRLYEIGKVVAHYDSVNMHMVPIADLRDAMG